MGGIIVYPLLCSFLIGRITCWSRFDNLSSRIYSKGSPNISWHHLSALIASLIIRSFNSILISSRFHCGLIVLISLKILKWIWSIKVWTSSINSIRTIYLCALLRIYFILRMKIIIWFSLLRMWLNNRIRLAMKLSLSLGELGLEILNTLVYHFIWLSVGVEYIISGRLIMNMNPRQHCLASDHRVAIFTLNNSFLIESKKWLVKCIWTSRNALGSFKEYISICMSFILVLERKIIRRSNILLFSFNFLLIFLLKDITICKIFFNLVNFISWILWSMLLLLNLFLYGIILIWYFKWALFFYL